MELLTSTEAWAALLRAHPRIVPGGRVIEASLSHLGVLGLDRYELKIRIVDSRGMLDDRIWLLERSDIEALHAWARGTAGSGTFEMLIAGSRPA